MARVRVRGAELFHEVVGEGEPLVLVHGGLTDHYTWQAVVPALAASFRVLVYDRRGHSGSTRTLGNGVRRDHEDDLAALMETLGFAPAHVAGNSFGASTALGLAVRRPGLFRSLIAHEPPLLGVIRGDDPAHVLVRAAQEGIDTAVALILAGEESEGVRRFMEEVALGPGSWAALPARVRAVLVANSRAFVHEQCDPGWASLDLTRLSGFSAPALLTYGTESLPWLPPVTVELSRSVRQAELRGLEGAGHVPQVSHPETYAEMVREFIAAV
ncbi:alpha/beta fold hydrolase [Streptomyces sp. NRRL B-1677]|uniref:Alpha/beta hydrolase n=1 Tax=Streptomyces klenkii TaxID=1420899 RepID=A0A3B0BNU6_9ACTN|nr:MULTISPECIES: alpha/beta hydrolase [Streptomyces]MBF6046301.1 alpha/beta fold hydrolase [Streptomyces sp. NRRL B-1677]RKN74550.1 alpha/beta hydrolase [Streptomyces klenkii]